MAELDQAMTRLTAAPHHWPAYLYETKVYRLRRFPYLLVYSLSAAAVQVIAVAHGKRRPGYWRRRLP
jgi:hypothetical protein